MRRILALLLVSALLAPAATAQAGPIRFCFLDDASGCSVVADLITDSGRDLRIEIDPDLFDFAPHSMFVALDCDCGESMNLTPQQDGGIWAADLAVNNKDLVVGTWTVTPQATSQSGQTQPLTGKALAVTADDSEAPTLEVEGLTDGTVFVGADQSVRVNATDSLLREVTYQIEGMPRAFPLPFPYSLSVATFKPGAQDLELVATDRAGHTTSLSLEVFADARNPEISLVVPEVAYLGIANAIDVQVTEHSGYTIVLKLGGGTALVQGEAGTTEHRLNVTPTRIGPSLLEIRVFDTLGNEVSIVQPMNVTRLETDLVLQDARIEGPVIQGEPLRVNITAIQSRSVAAIPVSVEFLGATGAGVEVPAQGAVMTEAQFFLEPGRYTSQISLSPPAEVLELDWPDNNRTLTLEVFLARVVHGNDTYHIRADDRGLPLEAVGPTGTTYELRTEDQGLSQVYAFNAGGQRLYWDPSSNTTVVPQQTTTTTTDNDAPGLPVLWLAGLVGAAAWVARRR